MLCKLADASTESQNVLLVTHGAWIMCLQDYLFANPEEYKIENFDERMLRIGPPNTSCTKLVIQKKNNNESEGRRLLQFSQVHSTAHLHDISFESED